MVSLSSLQGEKAAEGLRQRKKLPDVSASGAPLEGSTEVKEGNSEDRCPISGKQGVGFSRKFWGPRL